MAPLWHHVHHFGKTMTVKLFRRETDRSLNGVSECPRLPEPLKSRELGYTREVLWVWHNHLLVSVQTTQPYAPFGYWHGIPQMCLTDVSTHADKRPGPPGNLTVLVLEMPSPLAGCLHCQSSHQSTSHCQQLWATVKPRDFNEMARWWKCCNAFFVAFIPQNL